MFWDANAYINARNTAEDRTSASRAHKLKQLQDFLAKAPPGATIEDAVRMRDQVGLGQDPRFTEQALGGMLKEAEELRNAEGYRRSADIFKSKQELSDGLGSAVDNQILTGQISDLSGVNSYVDGQIKDPRLDEIKGNVKARYQQFGDYRDTLYSQKSLEILRQAGDPMIAKSMIRARFGNTAAGAPLLNQLNMQVASQWANANADELVKLSNLPEHERRRHVVNALVNQGVDKDFAERFDLAPYVDRNLATYRHNYNSKLYSSQQGSIAEQRDALTEQLYDKNRHSQLGEVIKGAGTQLMGQLQDEQAVGTITNAIRQIGGMTPVGVDKIAPATNVALQMMQDPEFADYVNSGDAYSVAEILRQTMQLPTIDEMAQQQAMATDARIPMDAFKNVAPQIDSFVQQAADEYKKIKQEVIIPQIEGRLNNQVSNPGIKAYMNPEEANGLLLKLKSKTVRKLQAMRKQLIEMEQDKTGWELHDPGAEQTRRNQIKKIDRMIAEMSTDDFDPKLKERLNTRPPELDTPQRLNTSAGVYGKEGAETIAALANTPTM